jgi:thiamine-monophosphate kinase
LRPNPRFDLLAELNTSSSLLTALIDISDGLSSELNHIARQSKVGIELEAARIPLHPEALKLAHRMSLDALEWALSGGEDYELLATLDDTALQTLGAPPKGFTLIGRVVEAKQGVSIIAADGSRHRLGSSGYNHFR